MTKDEALRLALEALKNGKRVRNAEGGTKYQPDLEDKAITAIKAALEAKDEPDQYAMDIECTKCGAKQSGVLTVHTTPPQRTWVGLTDEEIDNITAQKLKWQILDLCLAIEAKLKEKNNG